jgi:uncharacterized protein (TIGR03435 family)
MMRSPVMRFVILAALMALGARGLRAQLTLPKEGETQPAFEVSTVRVSTERSDGVVMRMQWGPDSCQIDNLPLRTIIHQAYGAASDDQIVGGPDSLMDGHFDINAKAEPNDAEQMKKMTRDDRNRESRLMLQSLLADRFHLKVHIETKELPVYALVAAKGGAKLKASAPPPATPPDDSAPASSAALTPDQMPKTPPRGGMRFSMSSTKAEVNATDGTMAQLANILTSLQDTEGRVVIDKTGLTGKYDWSLSWAPSMGMGGTIKGADNGTGPDADAPGLFTALEEQLGLKLEPQKGPVQVVVVDHVEAPSAN